MAHFSTSFAGAENMVPGPSTHHNPHGAAGEVSYWSDLLLPTLLPALLIAPPPCPLGPTGLGTIPDELTEGGIREKSNQTGATGSSIQNWHWSFVCTWPRASSQLPQALVPTHAYGVVRL